MRLVVEMKGEKIPLSYKMMGVSLIKQALESANREYFNSLYSFNGKSNKLTKSFTYGLALKDYKIEDDIIKINDRCIMTISSPDYEFGFNLYNGLLRLREFTYKEEYKLVKTRVYTIPEKKINSNEVVFKALSPIVIKDKSGDFIAPEHENYIDSLNYIADKALEVHRGYGLKCPVSFEKVLMKKVVAKEEIRGFSDKTDKRLFYITGYKGIFKLTGDKEDLNLLYQLGIGFRRNQGFGLVEVL